GQAGDGELPGRYGRLAAAGPDRRGTERGAGDRQRGAPAGRRVADGTVRAGARRGRRWCRRARRVALVDGAVRLVGAGQGRGQARTVGEPDGTVSRLVLAQRGPRHVPPGLVSL